ncbi:hypothetical protein H0264_19450 [Nocardia huaxiensis]|uniref:Uncharacterized protein n=1 Tax=Nocardia huaxiensis TaxID=2755382 RepID=A0A7D6V6L3_9NOCA|nr:hypothetical protein [Nocardia huaxiensis]QLY27651.1 hypothetical protein H0264_19450 [Nocardia huaxiensis]
MVDDVEKRWNDPPTFRRAARYVIAVIALTGIVMAAALVWAASRQECLDAENMRCDTASRLVVGLGPALVLLGGGIVAFVITFRQWRGGKPWPIWQGAGWFLFTLMVMYLAVAGGTG